VSGAKGIPGPDPAAVRAAADTLSARYGEDAPVIAIMRAAEAAALGDLETSDHWQAVADALEGGWPPLN
jgi:hypothetical protein